MSALDEFAEAVAAEDFEADVARARLDDATLGRLLRKFFWNDDAVVQITTQPIGDNPPYIWIQGKADLNDDEVTLLKRLHAERIPTSISQLDDAHTFGTLATRDGDDVTLHELADEPEGS